MREATRKNDLGVPEQGENARRFRKRVVTYCSVCNSRVFFHPVRLMEPEGVPEPRLIWTLCRACYHVLLAEMRRSPIKSPLRLRVAMGLVAAERWSQAYPTRVRTYISDRRWFIFIAVGFIVAMLLHLALIVAIAALH